MTLPSFRRSCLYLPRRRGCRPRDVPSNVDPRRYKDGFVIDICQRGNRRRDVIRIDNRMMFDRYRRKTSLFLPSAVVVGAQLRHRNNARASRHRRRWYSHLCFPTRHNVTSRTSVRTSVRTYTHFALFSSTTSIGHYDGLRFL